MIMASTADYTDPLAPDPTPRKQAPYPHDPNDPTQPAVFDPGNNPVRPDYAALARKQEADDKVAEQARKDREQAAKDAEATDRKAAEDRTK